jgi:hypothetical protein
MSCLSVNVIKIGARVMEHAARIRIHLPSQLSRKVTVPNRCALIADRLGDGRIASHGVDRD